MIGADFQKHVPESYIRWSIFISPTSLSPSYMYKSAHEIDNTLFNVQNFKSTSPLQHRNRETRLSQCPKQPRTIQSCEMHGLAKLAEQLKAVAYTKVNKGYVKDVSRPAASVLSGQKRAR